MEVLFGNRRLQNAYEKSAEATRRWGPEVARKYVTRIEMLHAAENFQTARKIQSLRLHPLKGARSGDWAI